MLYRATNLDARAGEPPNRVVIHLLGPRSAIAGEQTVPIEWHGGKTDRIATRPLNIAEAKKLRTLLRQDLATESSQSLRYVWFR